MSDLQCDKSSLSDDIRVVNSILSIGVFTNVGSDLNLTLAQPSNVGYVSGFFLNKQDV